MRVCVLFSTLLPHLYNKSVMYKKLWNSIATHLVLWHTFCPPQIFKTFFFPSTPLFPMALASINYHQSHLPLLPPHLQQVIPSACTYYNCSTIFPAPQISDPLLHFFLSHEVLKYQELAFQCIFDRGTSSEASYYICNLPGGSKVLVDGVRVSFH